MDNSDGEGRKTMSETKMKRKTSGKGSKKHKKKESSQERDADKGHHHHEMRIEMLSPKQPTNGFVPGGEEEDEESRSQPASIKGMWKKALKTLKSGEPKPARLSKKGSFTKSRGSESEEESVEPPSKEIDPVYSLLKCAADLPKNPKAQKEGSYVRGDSWDGLSKPTSPSSSGATGTHPPTFVYCKQHSVDSTGGSSVGSRDSRATSPAFPALHRDSMHQLVDDSLGSEFRTFYKLTCPVKKHWYDGPSQSLAAPPHSSTAAKRHSIHSGSLDHR